MHPVKDEVDPGAADKLDRIEKTSLIEIIDNFTKPPKRT
jgi:hypothetical protein